MSIFFNKAALTAGGQNARNLQAQYGELSDMRLAGDSAHVAMINAVNQHLSKNAARTPSEAYREMDAATKMVQVPAGEHALLTRLMPKSKVIALGPKLFEYRKTSSMERGNTSMTGQTGVLSDKIDYTYGGAIVPIHDKGFGIDWREFLAMKADGYDALVDYSQAAQRQLVATNNDYLWNGDSSLVFKEKKWEGIKGDSSVATATLSLSITMTGSETSEDVMQELRRLGDIMRITNNVSARMTLVISRETMSVWEATPFSIGDKTFGSMLDYISSLRYFSEVVEDAELSGDELAMINDDPQGFHGVSGMAISTYALPRPLHNSPFDYIKWNAQGWNSRSDFDGLKNALYASS